MVRDVSACNTYNYGDALYWDARYIQEAACGSFDWYQRYSALRPFVRNYVPTTSRILMVGCGNAVMSEDMVKDGYEEIVNVDISTVAIDMMRRKYEHIPQLKCILAEELLNCDLEIYVAEILQMLPHSCLYLKKCVPLEDLAHMQMDVRDMSFFPDESFDAVIDKGTLDSLMCGTNAPICAAQMLGEVSRLLKNGGVYMLITYGDPSARMPHLSRPVFNWKIELYIISRPGFQKRGDSPSNVKSYLEPIPLTEKGLLPADYVLEDPDSHFIYICKKIDEPVELSNNSADPLTPDSL